MILRTTRSAFLPMIIALAFSHPVIASTQDRNQGLDTRIRVLVSKLGVGVDRATCGGWAWGSGTDSDRAAAELAIIGEPVVEYVLPLLRSPVEWRRVFAIDILQRVRDPRTIDPLIRTLRTDKAAGVRAHVADALMELKEPLAAEALLEALSDKDEYVRASVAAALGALREQRAIPGLIRLLGERMIVHSGPISFLSPMECAIDALARIGRPAVTPLLEALSNKDKYTRAYAAAALGKIKAGEAVSELIRLLQDGRDEVREKAAEALGEIGDPTAYEMLALAARSTDKKLAWEAVRALGKLGDRRATPLMIEFLDGKDEGMQSVALQAAGGLNDPTTIDSLARHLRDSEPGSSLWAATSLGQINDPRAAEALIDAVTWGDNSLRSQCVRELSKRSNPSAMPTFLRGLHDKEYDVRNYSAVGIGRLDPARLLSLMEDRDPQIRSAAVFGVQEVKDHRAIPTLIKSLNDPNSRCSSICALGAMEDVKIIPHLLPYLKDGYEFTRLAAIGAIDALQKIERSGKR